MKTGTTTKLIAAMLAVAMAIAAFAFIPRANGEGMQTAYAADGDLRVHFIDCGQADACYIEFPDGKSMLIDTGDRSSDSYGNVIEYLDDQGVQTLDWLILTHSDADHIGGATHVLEEYEVKTIYRPHQACAPEEGDDGATDTAYEGSEEDGTGFYAEIADNNIKTTATYQKAIAAAYAETYTENGRSVPAEVYVTNPFNERINHIAGESFEYTFDFYSPVHVEDYDDSNDFSPVMVLSYEGRDFVLTGDAEKDNEADFVELVRNSDVGSYGGRYDKFIRNEFTADVIKMGHHGSSTSSGEDFLEIMTANEQKRPNIFTIFSCGDGNSYGHPHKETLQRLMDMGFSAERIERTDLNGDIVFGVSASGALALSEETPDVTNEAKLTTGNGNDKRPQETIKDNGVKPDETIDDLPDARQSNGNMPDLFDPATWARSPAEWHILQWVVIVVAVLAVIAVIAVAVMGTKKRKRKRRK